ncbi:acetyl-CoA carboxylase biotin carboxyl carrier protein [Lactobacillus sp. B4007]|uniref:acetyl-CoA carboxylase biotin carboxyl carrier protein n=1 Tax=Lactobacillus sp. B4007 TaxID=2818032 RepID=UPI00226A4104|nr:acetyl-CoA carboxylase biotin carboxyl carrier protein [Lactobacillus sp. B4007]MCX8724664.1 acetyl-CoA carboxylase biotin carboxyl carrier protein [Lactobacillus sp. B4007]
MKFAEIQELIAQIDQSEIQKLELDFEGGHILIDKRDIADQPVQVTGTGEEVAKQEQASPALPTASAKAVPESAKQATEVKANTVQVKAPLVGIVYLQPSPDKPQYKKVGDHVQKGEVVCLIEAMKMMTEIKSTSSGTITEILVANEEVVEYDQPLMTIIPD